MKKVSDIIEEIDEFNIKIFFLLILIFIIIPFSKTILERIEANELTISYNKGNTLHCETKDTYLDVKKGDGSFIKEYFIYKDNKKFMILNCYM